MPDSVYGSQPACRRGRFTVHGKIKNSVNCQPLALNSPNGLTVNRRRFGFTLLELLLAITIAGILASIVTVTFVGEQKKARDAQRKRDLNTIKSVLEVAKRDCSNIYYPATSNYFSLGNYLTNTNTHYIGTWPKDPKTGNNTYQYVPDISTLASSVCPDISGTRTQSGIQNYYLSAPLEITSDPDIQNSFNRCKAKPSMPATPGNNYYVCND